MKMQTTFEFDGKKFTTVNRNGVYYWPLQQFRDIVNLSIRAESVVKAGGEVDQHPSRAVSVDTESLEKFLCWNDRSAKKKKFLREMLNEFKSTVDKPKSKSSLKKMGEDLGEGYAVYLNRMPPNKSGLIDFLVKSGQSKTEASAWVTSFDPRKPMHPDRLVGIALNEEELSDFSNYISRANYGDFIVVPRIPKENQKSIKEIVLYAMDRFFESFDAVLVAVDSATDSIENLTKRMNSLEDQLEAYKGKVEKSFEEETDWTSQVAREVSNYSKAKGVSHQQAWRRLYSKFRNVTGIDLYKEVDNHDDCTSKLDVIRKLGMSETLLDVAYDNLY